MVISFGADLLDGNSIVFWRRQGVVGGGKDTVEKLLRVSIASCPLFIFPSGASRFGGMA